MLAQFFTPIIGGEERVVEHLSVELARRGHEVAVGTLRLPGTPRLQESDGVRVHRLDALVNRLERFYGEAERRHLPPVPDPLLVRELRSLVENERPDVVHAHNWIVHSYLPLKKRAGAPLVLSLHDYSLVCANKRLIRFGGVCGGPGPLKCLRCAVDYYGVAKGAFVTGSLKTMSPLLHRRVDMFVPVSRAVADAVGLSGGSLPYEVIPNPIIASTDNGRPPEDLLDRLPREDFILFLGDVRADKGARVLLDAYALLESPPPLVFVGREGDLDEGDLPPGVAVLGPWPHRAALEAVRRCALLVLPSLAPETFGMAALEAMAAGRAVVASDIGGLRDLVADRETGRLVEPGNPVALHEAIRELLRDPAARGEMERRARLRAEAYSPQEVVPRFERMYESLTRGAAGGTG